MPFPTTKSERTDAITRSLDHHAPSDDAIASIGILRDHAKTFAAVVIGATESRRESSLALTHLEDTLMWAVKAVILQDAEANDENGDD